MQRAMSKRSKQQRDTAKLIFPHQLFRGTPLLEGDGTFFLIEEDLFFSQFRFHKQKLIFHRASMRFYSDFLQESGHKVEYIESRTELSDVRNLLGHLRRQGFVHFQTVDVVDDWLRRRIKSSLDGADFIEMDSPGFLNTTSDIESYFPGRKRFLQADFYTRQRKMRGILLEEDGGPLGGKWSFDEDNRKRFPKSASPPPIASLTENGYAREAREYVHEKFRDNPGEMTGPLAYPTTFEEADRWLEDFLTQRFIDFGIYEDAIVGSEHLLNHSLLSPLLNSGLLEAKSTVDRIIEFGLKESIPLNSLEGLIRQIVGWREFIRGVYETSGRRERTANFWGFKRKIPEAFWTAKTGITPVDTTIAKILRTGYCHHIERLMILGNFMLLCEFDPDEVHRWFMEMFIDSYDWVMVPNVYGMSQFADGGLMSTKPYISGSNYLLKMGDFPKGEWQGIWDALFWSFLDKNRPFFSKNPRLSMLLRTFDRFPPEKRASLVESAETYLASLDA